jgi:hypothetical protein
VEGKLPILLVECKWNDTGLDPALRYLKERFPAAEAWQISAVGKKDYRTDTGIRVTPALKFLRSLI